MGSISLVTFKFSKAAGREARRGFCHHGTILIACRRNRGTNLLATTNLSRCRNLVEAGLRSDRGTNLSRSQKFVTVQKFDQRADERIRVPVHDELSRKQKALRKNRDEFINATVRVRLSNYYFGFTVSSRIQQKSKSHGIAALNCPRLKAFAPSVTSDVLGQWN